MSGNDLFERLEASMPDLRGRLRTGSELKEYTWFRVGGPAEVLFSPADNTRIVREGLDADHGHGDAAGFDGGGCHRVARSHAVCNQISAVLESTGQGLCPPCH